LFSFIYTQKLKKNKINFKDLNVFFKFQNKFNLTEKMDNNSKFLDNLLFLNNFFKKNNLKNFFFYIFFLNKKISSKFF